MICYKILLFLVSVWFVLCYGEISARRPHLQNDNTQNVNTPIEKMCRGLCQTGGVCPPECAEVFLDPWSNNAPASQSQVSFKKRLYNGGIDGLTFEDYLFMRWLGRDMIRRRLE